MTPAQLMESSKRAKRDPSHSAPADGLVAFRVDGERFEILEQTIRARGDTLLATLLDDPQRDTRHEICVEGNKQRFRYILDWYRYGSILLPYSISVAEMRRDCAFFQLPDDLSIQNEQATLIESEEMLDKRLNEIVRRCEGKQLLAEQRRQSAQTQIAAMTLVKRLISDFHQIKTTPTVSRRTAHFRSSPYSESFRGTHLQEVVQGANEVLAAHGYAVRGWEKAEAKGKGKGKWGKMGKGKGGDEVLTWQFQLRRANEIDRSCSSSSSSSEESD